MSTTFKVAKAYGIKGVLKALENEVRFLKVIQSGWLGYGIYMGHRPHEA